MHIAVSRYGRVDDKEVERITEAMRECYSRLRPHELSIVDLYLFERSSSVEAFFTKECREVGVASARFDELFFALHDAWRGIPRISICLEKMKALPTLVQTGGIHHEVGHSVLHGNLSYYLLSIPPALLKTSERFNLHLEFTTNLLYLISISVKDYEVTRLLHHRGYVEDQVAYVEHLLKASEDDIASWKFSRGNPRAEALCLISCLKAAGCAAPLLADRESGEQVRNCLEEGLSYLPADRSSLLLRVTEDGFPSLGADTADNVDRMIRVCKLIFEEVFNR